MGTKWVMLWKDKSKRKFKPAASSCSVLPHSRGLEKSVNVAFLLHGQAHPVLEQKSWALPVLTFNFPSQDCRCRSKIRLNSTVLQHRRTKALFAKIRDAASDGKLRPQQSSHSEVKLEFLHQIKQKHTSFTWNHQTDILSLLMQERTNLCFSGPCLYKAL